MAVEKNNTMYKRRATSAYVFVWETVESDAIYFMGKRQEMGQIVYES